MATMEERKNNYEEIEKELGLDQEDNNEQLDDENDYSDDDEGWDDDDDDLPVTGARAAPSGNASSVASASARATNQEQLFAKVQSRINLEPLAERSAVEKSVTKQERKEDELRHACSFTMVSHADCRVREKEKSDRATSELVLDPRTRMILFKLLNRGFLDSIHGCVSTGKEANVYHGIRNDGSELAVKIYKTSILVRKFVTSRMHAGLTAGRRCSRTETATLRVSSASGAAIASTIRERW